MNCKRFEELLFESLEARLGAVDTERLRTHARSCVRCRELAALMCDDVDEHSVEVPDDLVTGVLAATSGSACERAHLLLAEGADGPLGVDGGLLSIHLGTCTDCAHMARALVQLQHELPSLAELEPDDRFVADVMTATIGATEPMPVPLLQQIGQWWDRAVQRPRFAFEAAYAGVLMVFLLFGLPSESVTKLPSRALDGIRQESIGVERAVSAGFDGMVDAGRDGWSVSMQRAATYFDESVARGPVSSRVESDVRSWVGVTRDLAVRVWDRLVVPFAENLRSLWQGPAGADDVSGSTDERDTVR